MMIEFNHHDRAVHLVIESALVSESPNPCKVSFRQMARDIIDAGLPWTLRKCADMNID